MADPNTIPSVSKPTDSTASSPASSTTSVSASETRASSSTPQPKTRSLNKRSGLNPAIKR